MVIYYVMCQIWRRKVFSPFEIMNKQVYSYNVTPDIMNKSSKLYNVTPKDDIAHGISS